MILHTTEFRFADYEGSVDKHATEVPVYRICAERAASVHGIYDYSCLRSDLSECFGN